MAGRKRIVLQGGAENALAECPEGNGYTYLSWVDCIVAGVPCQDVSIAGKQAGLKGERTGLFYEFARILQELRPAWFVFENVPGLLSSNQGRDFAEVLRVLMVECGYGVCWRVLDSQFFGVAQRRRRVFIVGRFGKPCPAEVLFEPEGCTGDSAQGRKAGASLAHAITRGAGTNRYDPNGEDFVVGSESGQGWWNEGFGTLRAEGENRPTRPSHLVATLNSGGNKGGFRAVAFALPSEHRGQGNAWNTNYEAVCSPPDPDGMRDLAGLPEGLDSPRYRALGNAVTVSVAEWIGRRIVEAAKKV